ncbi:hypothetical protein ABLL_1213 [Arcobacter sp. L]|nr:hypothetical protein ABLL_1213 [Arcobacter sp. L]
MLFENSFLLVFNFILILFSLKKIKLIKLFRLSFIKFIFLENSFQKIKFTKQTIIINKKIRNETKYKLAISDKNMLSTLNKKNKTSIKLFIISLFFKFIILL